MSYEMSCDMSAIYLNLELEMQEKIEEYCEKKGDEELRLLLMIFNKRIMKALILQNKTKTKISILDKNQESLWKYLSDLNSSYKNC